MKTGHPAISRRRVLALAGAGAATLVAPTFAAKFGRQEPAAGRRDVSLTARNYAFSPDRIEVTKDDRVRLTIEGADQIHSFAIDEYRIARRLTPGTSTVIEFRADRVGSFTYYCNIAADPGCKTMRGTLVVSAR